MPHYDVTCWVTESRYGDTVDYSVLTSTNGFQAWNLGVTFTDRARAERVAAVIREAMEEEGVRR
jgi:hypothetical protein